MLKQQSTKVLESMSCVSSDEEELENFSTSQRETLLLAEGQSPQRNEVRVAFFFFQIKMTKHCSLYHFIII